MSSTSLQLKKIQDNKYLNSLMEAIKFIAVVALIVLGVSLAFKYVPFLAKYDHYVIQTGSMEPVIHTGDLVIVDNTVDIDSIKRGDIIAFNIDLNGDEVEEVVVHYFSERVERDGVEYFKSIPAVSSEQDPWTLNVENIVGVYAFKVSYIGKFVMFAQSTIGRIVIIVDILLISLMMDLLKKEKVEE